VKVYFICSNTILLVAGTILANDSVEVFAQLEPVLKQYQSLKYGLNFLYPAEWGNQSDRCPLFCGPTFLITSNGTISQSTTRQC
jgi:hypothetical protein